MATNGGIIGKTNNASYGKDVITSKTSTGCVTLGTGTTIVQAAIVAGGGGGAGTGGAAGGGGGAGGLRNIEINASGPVPVTVGGGGAAGAGCAGAPGRGTIGNDSIFNPGGVEGNSMGTSTGGGGGGCRGGTGCGETGIGGTGGSGGGGGSSGAGCGPKVGGAGNTPPVSPPQGNTGGNGITCGTNASGGGGGGAGAVGTNGLAPQAGPGGAGTDVSPDYGNIGPTCSVFAGGRPGDVLPLTRGDHQGSPNHERTAVDRVSWKTWHPRYGNDGYVHRTVAQGQQRKSGIKG